MANSMDMQFGNPNITQVTIANIPLPQLYQNAMQNPYAFQQYVMNNMPQAYQRAMQIMQSGNPQAVIMQMLQANGLNLGNFKLR